MMCFNLFTLVLTLCFQVDGYGLMLHRFPAEEGSLPQQINLGSGESLYLAWKPTDSPLVGCLLIKPNGLTVALPNSSEKDIEFLGPTMGQGYCGARVSSLSANDTGIWTLQAKSKTEQFSTTTNVTVLAPLVIVNRTVTSSGEGVRFTCGRDFPDVVQCELISPTGQKTLFNQQCSDYFVDSDHVVTSKGLWLCKFTVVNYVSDFWASVQLNLQVSSNEIGYKEFPNEVVVYCNLPKEKKMTKNCKLTTPLGEEMNLGPGKGLRRYFYYGSNPSECGVSIPKPLRQEDIGPWKCDLAVNSDDHYGGYVTVGNVSKNLMKVEVEKENLFLSKETSSSVSLKCHVNHSIEYCWFKDPIGQIYHVKDSNGPYRSEPYWSFMFGDCVLKNINMTTKNSTGKWTCHLGLIGDSLFELTSSISVVYSENLLVAPKDELEAEVGGTADIFCRTGDPQKIEYCRFIRPDGQGLTIGNTLNTTMYSYLGDGYIYGHCGVRIHRVSENDFGRWTCIIKLNSDEQKSLLQLTKKVEGMSSLAVFGIVAAVLFLLSVGGFLAYSRFKLPCKRTGEYETSPLVNGDEDDQSIETLSGRIRPEVRRRQRRPLAQSSDPQTGSTSWF